MFSNFKSCSNIVQPNDETMTRAYAYGCLLLLCLYVFSVSAFPVDQSCIGSPTPHCRQVQYAARLRHANQTLCNSTDNAEYPSKFETVVTGNSYTSTFENFILKNR